MANKVLCIYGNQVYYGHERANMQVLHLLRCEGLDLLVLINKDGIAPEAEKIIAEKQLPFKKIPYPIWRDIRKPFSIQKICRYFVKVIKHNISFLKIHRRFKPDYIYIANDFMYINLIPSFIFTNTKIIYRLGDAPVLGWAPFNFFWRNYIIKRTDQFVCVSQYIRNKIIEIGRNSSARDKVIYSFPAIRIASDNDTLAINYEKKGITFSYLGQIIKSKGVADFIDAAMEICKKYSNIYFLIAGSLSYDLEFADAQKAKVDRSEYAHNIIFLDTIENIAQFFQKTDVLVIPSIKQEPLANVLVEAKNNSTPSIIYPSGGLPELITHQADGYICNAPTATDIFTAMEYYIQQPQLIDIQGTNAFNSIEKLGIGYIPFKESWRNIFV